MKYSRDIQHDYQPPEPRHEFSTLFKDLMGGVLLTVLVFVNVFLILGL